MTHAACQAFAARHNGTQQSCLHAGNPCSKALQVETLTLTRCLRPEGRSPRNLEPYPTVLLKTSSSEAGRGYRQGAPISAVPEIRLHATERYPVIQW
jgi:hypothetical protein